MNWEEWIVANKKQLEHIAGFEEKFVRTILAKIPEIEPQDVTTQYHFKDSTGKNRYIDFMIINKTKGYKLPIELDGMWKVQSYEEFDDMLKRQNDLVKIYGVLLRYTNKKMLNEAQVIVDEIRQTLHLQSTNQLTAKVIEEKNKKRFDEYQSQLAWYKQQMAEQQAHQELKVKTLEEQKNDTAESTITKEDIAELQATISALQAKIEQPVPVFTEPLKEQKTKITLNHMLGIGAVSLIVVALGANSFYGKDNSDIDANNPEALVGNLYDSDDIKDDKITIVENNTESSSEPVQQENIESLPELATESVVTNNIEPDKPELQAKPQDEKSTLDEIEQPSYQEPSTIPASQAYKYIGSSGVVCGDVAQVKSFSRGTYLNLGARYPNQDVTIVVWNEDAGNFSDLSQYEGQSLCIKGSVKSYKGTPQIKLASMSQLN